MRLSNVEYQKGVLLLMKKRMNKVFYIFMLAIALFITGTSGQAKSADDASMMDNSCGGFMSSIYGNITDTPLKTIGEEISIDNFGGVYLNEAGNYVVNVTDIGETSKARYVLTQNDINNVTFSTVKYSLLFLENAVDLLVPYMDEYRIMMLDANDKTNLLDIFLSDYSEQNIERLVKLISTLGIPKDCINFVNCDGIVAKPTVMTNDNNSVGHGFCSNESLTAGIYNKLTPGFPITVGSYDYTLGPYRNGRFLTAGHLVMPSSLVRVPISPLTSETIGKIADVYFGGYSDISTIALNSGYTQTEALSYNFLPAIVSAPVTMIGAVSKCSNGGILGVNAEVIYEGLGTLTLAYGTYSCAKGDSGGPIFNRATVTNGTIDLGSIKNCFGVQSGGTFDDNDNWTGISFFTASNNFPN